MNKHINRIDSNKQNYMHLSNGWYRSIIFLTCLECDYNQVIMNVFCENVTDVDCLVLICNHALLLFLYHKVCVNLDPQWYATWQERQDLQSTKPLVNVYVYWNARNVSPLMMNPSPDDLLTVNISTVWKNRCLFITRTARLLSEVYNWLK